MLFLGAYVFNTEETICMELLYVVIPNGDVSRPAAGARMFYQVRYGLVIFVELYW